MQLAAAIRNCPAPQAISRSIRPAPCPLGSAHRALALVVPRARQSSPSVQRAQIDRRAAERRTSSQSRDTSAELQPFSCHALMLPSTRGGVFSRTRTAPHSVAATSGAFCKACFDNCSVIPPDCETTRCAAAAKGGLDNEQGVAELIVDVDLTRSPRPIVDGP